MKRLGIIFALLMCFVASAEAAGTVAVRAGVHARYNRLVFDWSEPVKYVMKQSAGLVTIQFDKKDVTADFKNVTYTNPPFIRNVKQENKPEGLFVSFEIPDDSRVQAFWVEKKVAFDVLRLSEKQPEFKQAEKAQTPTPPTAAAGVETPAPAATAEPVKITETTGPQKAEPKPVVETAPVKEAEQGRKPLQTLADMLTESKAAPKAEETKQAAEEKPVAKKETTIISITPKNLTRLAVFERVGRLWVVIDKAEKELRPAVTGALSNELQKVTRISLKEATAFVFDVPIDLNTTKMAVRRDGTTWTVAIDPADENARLPAEMPIRVLEATDKNAEPAVTLYAGEQPVVLTFKDSKMGDNLWVVPVRTPEGRVATPRRTAGYFILPSFMGAVVAPRDDNLRIATDDDLVVLSPASGHKMMISDAADRKKGRILGAATPAFRLDIPALTADEGFVENRRALERMMLDEKSPDEKNKRLVDMARLYLRQGFAAEAGGLLKIALKSNPALEKRQDFRALRGMSAAMMGDLEGARKDLRADDMYSQPLSQLWMGYAFMMVNQPGLARDAFIESGSSDETLPPALVARVALAQSQAALDSGDMAAAEFGLKKIADKSALLPSEKAAYDYIRASVLTVTENKEDGLDMYGKIAQGGDQLYRTRAELQLIDQQVADKTLAVDKAIEKLEGLRFAWRGDRLEIDILRRLGALYVEAKDYMNALSIWRQAASLSKDPDDTDAITQSMQQAFYKLYVDGEADTLEPLKALAVFDRFRELTPPGEEGKIANRRLADRLISVDLLDQADAILENQVLKQSSGSEAASLGAKLAQIRLLNRDPAGALKALQESEQGDDMEEKLSKRRILLKARALADLGKIEDALALLQDDQFPEGLSLKADINWREGRWPQAVVTLQKLLTKYRDEGKGAIDGPMPPLILKMGIALALDDNRKGMDLLVAEYGPFMEKTKQGEAFHLITKPSRGSALADIQTLKGQVGEVELFEQFLKDFQS